MASQSIAAALATDASATNAYTSAHHPLQRLAVASSQPPPGRQPASSLNTAMPQERLAYTRYVSAES